MDVLRIPSVPLPCPWGRLARESVGFTRLDPTKQCWRLGVGTGVGTRVRVRIMLLYAHLVVCLCYSMYVLCMYYVCMCYVCLCYSMLLWQYARVVVYYGRAFIAGVPELL